MTLAATLASYSHFDTNHGPSFVSDYTTSFGTDTNSSFGSDSGLSFTNGPNTSYHTTPNSSFGPDTSFNTSNQTDHCKSSQCTSFSSADIFGRVPVTNAPASLDGREISRPVTPRLKSSRLGRDLQITPEPSHNDRTNSFSSPDTVCNNSLQNMFEGRVPVSDVEYSASGAPPPKRKRALQACITCRKRKSGCNEARPRCSQCKTNNLSCDYDEPRPNKKLDAAQLSEKNHELIKQISYQVEHFVSPFVDDYKNLLAENERLKAKLPFQFHSFPPAGIRRSQESVTQGEPYRLSEPSSTFEPSYSNQADGTTLDEGQSRSSPHRRRSSAGHSPHSFLDQSTPSRQLAQIWNCNTPDMKSVRRLCFGFQIDDGNESLPQLAKQAVNKLELAPESLSCSPPSFPSTLNESYIHVGHSDAALNGLSPQMYDRPSEVRPDGLKAESLWHAYLDNVHRSLDFLDVSKVEKAIEKIKAYRDHSSAPFTPGQSRAPMRGVKRKYAEDNTTPEMSIPRHISLNLSSTSESFLDSAILLFVLALGELYQRELSTDPGLENEYISPCDTSGQTSKSMKDRFLPPPPSISISTLRRSGLLMHDYLYDQYTPRYKEESPNLRGTPAEGIPGLHYYCCAVGLLGESDQVSELAFAHAKMLAAIYLIGLGRPKEARHHVKDAIATLELIQDPDAILLDPATFDSWHNSWSVSYRVCYSLEHEIIAVLDSFTPSSIPKFESRIPLPRGPFDKLDLFSMVEPNLITAVRSLVKQINASPKPSQRQIANSGKEQNINVSKVLEYILKSGNMRREMKKWKQCIHEAEQLRDSYHIESSSASSWRYVSRRKASFSSLLSAIHRQLLHCFLQNFVLHKKPQDKLSTFADSANFPEEIRTKDFEISSFAHEVWEAVKTGTDALMQNTRDFDAITAMPMIESAKGFVVIGAQAQFTNILLLTQIYISDELNDIIDRDDFRHNLETTIKFFTSVAPISSVIETELLILLDISKTYVHHC